MSIVAEFILIDKDIMIWFVPSTHQSKLDVAKLVLVVAIWAMNVISSTLVADAYPVEQL